MPVFTTNMGKGAVDEMHPLSAGCSASLVGLRSLGRQTKAIVEESDLVILAGTRAPTGTGPTAGVRYFRTIESFTSMSIRMKLAAIMRHRAS